MNIRSAISGIITGDQALFIDKSLFKEVGCYPNIAIMEDITLAKNLKKYGKPFRIYSCVHSSARRWLQYGVYKTILLMWCLRLKYYFGTYIVKQMHGNMADFVFYQSCNLFNSNILIQLFI